MRIRRGPLLALLLPLTMAWPLAARAQLGGATIVVRVTDSTGAAVADAQVEAQSSTASEVASRVGRSDGGGVAVLANVAAGLVRLRVAARGFARFEHQSGVGPGGLIQERVVLEVRCEECPANSGPFGDRGNWHVRGRFDAALLRDLPLSASVWAPLETAEPAAIMDRIEGPGLYLGEPGRFSMHGSSWTQNRVMLGGLDVTDGLRGGVPLAYPDPGALDAINVTSALAPVEYGAPGVTMALSPREPAQSWGGQVQASWAPSGWQAKPRAGDAPSIARLGSLGDVSGLVGGPISDRLRILVAGRGSRVRRFERDLPEELKAELGSGLAHVVYRAGDRDTLRLVASYQTLSTPFAGRPRFSDRTLSEHDDLVGGQLHWDHAGEQQTWSVFAGYQQGRFRPQTAGRTSDQPIERLLDGPVPELVFPSRSRRATWTAGASVGLKAARVAGLWHALRVGATVTGSSANERPDATGVTAELVNGIPARVWDFNYAGESQRRTSNGSLYAADRLIFRDRFFLEAGLRLDTTTGSARGAAQGVQWTSVSPRASARLRLTRFGRITLLGGHAQYQHRLNLDALAFGDPAGAQGSVYRWRDPNGDGLFTPNERGVLVAKVGPGSPDATFSTIDASLKPPRTSEWVVGIESQPGRSWLIGLTGFMRKEKDLIESVNVGVPLSSYSVSYIPDPAGDLFGTQDDQMLPVYARSPKSFGQDRYVLTNPDGHTMDHKGLELRMEKRFGERLRLLAGAMAFRTDTAGGNRGFHVLENDQGVIGELYDTPNADTHALGRSYFDRAYVIKASVSYRAPGDVTIATVARYHDGQPFARYVVAADLPQGADLIPAVPRGQIGKPSAMDAEGRYIVPSGHRFTYTLTWDARLEKSLRIRGQRLALSAEVFNLLNLRHELEEDVVTGPSFRTPTVIQPPRMFRLGARYEF